MPPLKLRQYQVDDIDRIRAEIRSGKKRVVYVLATGGGKTVISAEIIRSAVAKGSKVFFVAHRKELIDQTSNKLHDFGVRHGVIMANHPLHDPSAPVQVVSIQTGIRRELPYKPDLVFVDECHRIAADSYKDFLLDCGDPVVVGITATPVRGDLQGLGGKIFQSMVVGPQMSALIQQGFLVKPRVFSWKINLKGVRLLGGDYNQKQLEEKMIDTKLVGDVYREWVKRCSNRSTVVFATSIAHSKMILDDFLANGIAAEHIDAKTPKEDREAVLSRLSSGYTQVVCNVGILTEGWDCPRVSAVCIVRPTRSESLYLQMAGRALRPWGDKTDCIAEGQLVLTDQGLVPIERISSKMRVWDGGSWRSHHGTICKGYQHVIDYAGLTATPDHKVWTKKGWMSFWECAYNGYQISQTGIDGEAIRESRGLFSRGDNSEKEQISVDLCEHCLRDVRKNSDNIPLKLAGRSNWRMQAVRPACKDSTMADISNRVYSATVHEPKRQAVHGLRWEGNRVQVQNCSGRMLVGTGEYRTLSESPTRSNRQRWPLRTREHSLVEWVPKPSSYSQKQVGSASTCLQVEISACSVCGQHLKPTNREFSIRGNRTSLEHPIIQAKRRVWDILNSGPFHRFTVSGLLVHNCIINDHGGVAQEFGTPDMDREWELDDTEISKPEKLEIRDKIRVCPECAEVYDLSVSTCICGYQFSKKPDEIKYGSGELHEVDYSIKREEKAKRKDYEWFLHQQRTMKKADGTPYSQGFAFAKYMAKYKEKPSWSWLKEWKKKNNVS